MVAKSSSLMSVQRNRTSESFGRYHRERYHCKEAFTKEVIIKS